MASSPLPAVSPLFSSSTAATTIPTAAANSTALLLKRPISVKAPAAAASRKYYANPRALSTDGGDSTLFGKAGDCASGGDSAMWLYVVFGKASPTASATGGDRSGLSPMGFAGGEAGFAKYM